MDREISLPFRVDSQGRVATTTDPSVRAKQHLLTFLLTRPDERVARTGFGSQLQDSLFEPLDELTGSLLLTRVRDEVGTYVPDVRLQQLSAPLDQETARLSVDVQYALTVGGGVGATDTATISMGETL